MKNQSLTSLVKILILGVGMSYILNGCTDNYELKPESGFYNTGNNYIGLFERNRAQVNNLIVLDKDLKKGYIYKDENNNLHLDEKECIIEFELEGYGVTNIIYSDNPKFEEYKNKFLTDQKLLEETFTKENIKKLDNKKTRKIINNIEVLL